MSAFNDAITALDRASATAASYHAGGRRRMGLASRRLSGERHGWRSVVKSVGRAASVVALVPGPIGVVAGLAAFGAAAALGDVRGMALAAVGLMGGVLLGRTITRLAGATRLGRVQLRLPGLGANSRLFGRGNTYRKGILNRGPVRIGWGPFSSTEAAFRVAVGPRNSFHFDILRSKW